MTAPPGLRATWAASRASFYRRPGGPWQVPTLDSLLSPHRPGPGADSGRPGVVDGALRLSRTGIEQLVGRVAGGLRAGGVRRGQVVSWQLPNGVVPVLLFRACWRLGAIAAPVLHSFGPSEREGALAQVDPALVIDLPFSAAGDPDALLGLCDGEPVAAAPTALRPSDLALVLFTSGSTGTPKAVLHSHRALSWKATLMAAVHGLGSSDAVLMPAPLAHISGLLNGILLPGAASMPAVLVQRFEPEACLRLIEHESITFMAGPPTFFVAMGSVLKEKEIAQAAASLRLISSGGASVTPSFVEETAQLFSCRVKRTYGSTEAPTVATSTNDDPFERARDTDGRAVGEVELRISDPDTGRQLSAGQSGELWVRGPELFAGYADGSQNAAVRGRGGWFRTGDLATVDPEGWLRIVGRLKDVIIRGGENISSSEVENALESHPAIRQAVVVGYPDPLMGERVAAFVVSPSEIDLETCREWFARRGVSRFKTPERVVRLDHLPLLGSGKPDRATLKALATQDGSGRPGAEGAPA